MDKRTCFFITLLLLILSLFSCPQKTTMRNVKFMAYDEQENKYIQKGNTILVKDGDKFSTTQNQRPTVQDVKVDDVDYKHIHWTLPSVPPTEDNIMTEGQEYSENTQINSDIILYAVYRDEGENKYTVTFKSFIDDSYQLIEAATKTEVRYQEKFNNVKPAVNPGKATIGGVEYTFFGWCEEQQPSSIIEHFQKGRIDDDNPEITESKTYCAVYKGDYLCFMAEEDGAQISFDFVGRLMEDDEGISLQYRTDGDTEFKPYKWIVAGEQEDSVKSAAEGLTITLSQSGSSVYFKGNNERLARDSTVYLNFKIKNNKKVSASGSVMSLVEVESRTDIPAQHCFNSLFLNCSTLTSAPILPATELRSNCYQKMFYGCESLKKAPDLPAETLSGYCYTSMFSKCTSLNTAPIISAKTLADRCCAGMFEQCTQLESSPILLAETLVSSCYSSMFKGCRNLNSVTCYGKTGIGASNLTEWLNGVASEGKFYCLDDDVVKSLWEYRTVSGLPQVETWTVESITAE